MGRATPTDLNVYIWQYHTPAKGLKPEKFTLMAAVSGIHDSSVTQQVELPADLPGVPDEDVYPSTGGPVLSWGYNAGNGIATAAIDPATLAVRWSTTSRVSSIDDSTVAFKDDSKDALIIRDVASGADTVVDSARLADFDLRIKSRTSSIPTSWSTTFPP